jgi:hypothetical protein
MLGLFLGRGNLFRFVSRFCLILVWACECWGNLGWLLWWRRLLGWAFPAELHFCFHNFWCTRFIRSDTAIYSFLAFSLTPSVGASLSWMISCYLFVRDLFHVPHGRFPFCLARWPGCTTLWLPATQWKRSYIRTCSWAHDLMVAGQPLFFLPWMVWHNRISSNLGCRIVSLLISAVLSTSRRPLGVLDTLF